VVNTADNNRNLYSLYGSKGSVIFLNGSDPDSRWGGGANSFKLYDEDELTDDQFTPKEYGHQKLDDWTIETVYYAGATDPDVKITQTISYVNGNSYFQITWKVKNIGSVTYPVSGDNVRFMHGGNSHFQFAGDGQSQGHWDDNLKIVYINDQHPQFSGIIGIYGSFESPVDSYYENYYETVLATALSGDLPGTVRSDGHDAAYALQWNKATLVPGEEWTITAFEKWTNAGFVQVIAPAEQTIVPNQIADNVFIIHNYGVGDTFNLDLISDNSWDPSWPSDIYVPTGDSETVTVRVTAPEGAGDGTSNTLP